MGTINHGGLVNDGFKLDQEEEQTRAVPRTRLKTLHDPKIRSVLLSGVNWLAPVLQIEMHKPYPDLTFAITQLD